MRRFSLLFQLLCNMGMKYIVFRTQYELKRKSGLLRKKYPPCWVVRNIPSLGQWRMEARPFFTLKRKENILPQNIHVDSFLKERVERMLRGDYCFFSSTWYSLTENYDWITNPDTGYQYDISRHWTEVEDYVKEAGDIKYVWEKSRFAFLYDFIRYDWVTGEDYSSFVFSQILDWIDKNPLNYGPNYKCSQEISLRVLNWIFALYYYKESATLTEEVFNKILTSIYGQMKHVRTNINFSRIAVRNNHAITETLALYIVGMLFPFFDESTEWKQSGKKWFEEEIKYQIAEDGTYLQYSMNYHRVVVQLLTWAIGLSDCNHERFCDEVYQKAYASVNFLFQCQDEHSGQLPNYGSNDGALFFKLNDDDYRDYRPQLDVLHYLLTGQNLYDKICEDRMWYNVQLSDISRNLFPAIKKQYGVVSFKKGGYFLFREKDSFTFIRCGQYKDRPAQADNLHIDIWYDGENILLDGGSYKYNASDADLKYFMGTESHNTVMLGTHDQMLKGSRFIWYNWTQALRATIDEDENDFTFVGYIRTYTYIHKGIAHKRKIIKKKGCPIWEIEDTIEHKPDNLLSRQLWHTKNENLYISSEGSIRNERIGWHSSYYGVKQECKQIEIDTMDNKLKTIIQLIK